LGPVVDDPLHKRPLDSGYEQGAYEDGETVCCKYFRKL
jgi:hypothetical protein